MISINKMAQLILTLLELDHKYQPYKIINYVFYFPKMSGNCNAPRAVTFAALLYCLRCLVGHDIPLNQVRRETPAVPVLVYVTV